MAELDRTAHTLAPINLWPFDTHLHNPSYMFGLSKLLYLHGVIQETKINNASVPPPMAFSEASAQIYRLPVFILLLSATFPAYLSRVAVTGRRVPLLLISAHIPAVWMCGCGSTLQLRLAICAIYVLGSRQCSLNAAGGASPRLPLNLSGIRCMRVLWCL